MCNKPILEYAVIARSAATRQSSNACLTDVLDCHAALAMTRVRDRAGCSRPFERGLTLIELLVFIVIIGIAANAMLAVFANLTRTSAGLLPDKQAQAIANSMMQEILAQPYTFCDPDAPNASTATAATSAQCGVNRVENIGPENVPAPVETRSGVRPFDNVNDYNLFNTTANTLSGLPAQAGYIVQVAVQSAGLIAGVPATETLRVTVTVTPPTGAPVNLDGVRFRYAPNT
jgi:MSHA pilin protein MshD